MSKIPYPTLSAKRVTVTIHPELLEKLLTALHPRSFTDEQTLYHMGYRQAQDDFKEVLTYHVNAP